MERDRRAFSGTYTHIYIVFTFFFPKVRTGFFQYLCVRTCLGMLYGPIYTCQSVHTEVREPFGRLSSLLPPGGFQGSNLGAQTWQYMPLPTESPSQLSFVLLQSYVIWVSLNFPPQSFKGKTGIVESKTLNSLLKSPIILI